MVFIGMYFSCSDRKVFETYKSIESEVFMVRRVESTDKLFSAIEKVTGNNPGATVVLAVILHNIYDERITLQLVNLFDKFEIYESDIWYFFKDRCDENCMILRRALIATDIGFISAENLKDPDFDLSDLPPIQEMAEQIEKSNQERGK